MRKGSCTPGTSKQRYHAERISMRLRGGFLLQTTVPYTSKERASQGGAVWWCSWERTCYEWRCPPVRVPSCCKQGCRDTLARSRSNQLGQLLPGCSLDHEDVGTLLFLPTNSMKDTIIPPKETPKRPELTQMSRFPRDLTQWPWSKRQRQVWRDRHLGMDYFYLLLLRVAAGHLR